MKRKEHGIKNKHLHLCEQKRGIDNFIQSEPEFLISVMDRHRRLVCNCLPDWRWSRN